MPDEALKPLGAISIAAILSATVIIVMRWPQGTKAKGISGHAGAQRGSYLLFAGTLTLVGTMFYLFMMRWFGPTIGAGWPFYVILTAGFMLQLLTAWLPEDGSGSRLARAHTKVAFTMAFMMMLLVGCVTLAPYAGQFVRILGGVIFCLMGLFWYLYFFVKSTRQRFLIYQNAYLLSFYLFIVVTTYAD